MEGGTSRKTDFYKGKNIIIHDNRGICSHVGYCTNGLPKVFRMGVKPWINVDDEALKKIIQTRKKCPSRALSYSINGMWMHRQERSAAGIPGSLIRFSVGVENFEDLIADLEQTLSAIV